MSENIEYQTPITNEVYCYTCLAEYEGNKKFYTVLFGPLLKVWIAPGTSVLESMIGVHRFITRTDQPMYLIPYDEPICDKYGKKVKVDLRTTDPYEPSSVVIPMEFELPIASFFQYKIKDGQLYKRECKEWKLVEI